MTIERLEIRGFTVFDTVDFNFSPGINVLIGENATGKSHALKLMYAVLRSTRKKARITDDLQRELAVGLASTFKTADDNLTPLVRSGAKGADVMLTTDQGELKVTINEQGDARVPLSTMKKAADPMFIPSREFLAAFESFIAVYQDRVLSFDETYYDLCLALANPLPRMKAKAAADALRARMTSLPTGKITLENGRFYVDMGDGKREAHLLAEGWRKIALLSHLVSNASIKQGTVLFWDEPEGGLNPKLVIELVRALRDLAAAGVQIVLATHDYLLAHQLSLRAEQGNLEPPVRFFSLHRPSVKEPVTVKWAATLAEIEHNPILAAYARHAEEEQGLVSDQLRHERSGGAG
ncbi:AAA family ATPase [Sorangium sp. KYC3313]|uniref:AAA family ATPase n=1 Tax=Sorangium sp. KYC3313 TaxID=3449740 RepID=UPI003F88CC14